MSVLDNVISEGLFIHCFIDKAKCVRCRGILPEADLRDDVMRVNVQVRSVLQTNILCILCKFEIYRIIIFIYKTFDEFVSG